MSVSRLDLIRHFERNGFFLRREGSNHSIYSNGEGTSVPIKRHRIFDRITANELCKEAGIPKIF
ncbi:MAG: type II toxin-antitoxin system HicA family toxin [Synergistaceae bacterium]|nr:type II toxin-antitoxin system HicA family toxin [Synergistaceae bacterium]